VLETCNVAAINIVIIINVAVNITIIINVVDSNVVAINIEIIINVDVNITIIIINIIAVDFCVFSGSSLFFSYNYYLLFFLVKFC
jgi:hypothetical protein